MESLVYTMEYLISEASVFRIPFVLIASRLGGYFSSFRSFGWRYWRPNKCLVDIHR